MSESSILSHTSPSSELAQTGDAPQLHAPPIPSTHGITRVHLMSIDPGSLYAYWELTPEFREMVSRHFRCVWDDLPLFLRLYTANELGENLTVAQETEVSRITDNYFFHKLLPGRQYVMDLGTRNVYNVFVALLRSNYVTTPRNWPGRSARQHLPTGLENWLPEAISSSYHRLG